MNRKIKVERTKIDLPALWEKGGAFQYEGNATIICDRFGKAKEVIFTQEEELGKHALIPVVVGDIVIHAMQDRDNYDIKVYRIQRFEDDFAVCEGIGRFDRGEWDKPDIYYMYFEAINEAKKKASCHLCRQPHFIKTFYELI